MTKLALPNFKSFQVGLTQVGLLATGLSQLVWVDSSYSMTKLELNYRKTRC